MLGTVFVNSRQACSAVNDRAIVNIADAGFNGLDIYRPKTAVLIQITKDLKVGGMLTISGVLATVTGAYEQVTWGTVKVVSR